MTKREAKRLAWLKAGRWLQGALDAGWPYNMSDDTDPPESEEDLERLQRGLEEIVDFCFSRAYRKPLT